MRAVCRLEGRDASRHPVCGPIVAGGPAALAAAFDLEPEEAGYVDACHLCYRLRQRLVDRLPGALAPRQVYGLGEDAA